MVSTVGMYLRARLLRRCEWCPQWLHCRLEKNFSAKDWHLDCWSLGWVWDEEHWLVAGAIRQSFRILRNLSHLGLFWSTDTSKMSYLVARPTFLRCCRASISVRVHSFCTVSSADGCFCSLCHEKRSLHVLGGCLHLKTGHGLLVLIYEMIFLMDCST